MQIASTLVISCLHVDNKHDLNHGQLPRYHVACRMQPLLCHQPLPQPFSSTETSLRLNSSFLIHYHFISTTNSNVSWLGCSEGQSHDNMIILRYAGATLPCVTRGRLQAMLNAAVFVDRSTVLVPSFTEAYPHPQCACQWCPDDRPILRQTSL